MDITQKINAFVQLGHTIEAFSADQKAALGHMVKTKNEWFTPKNLELALQGLQQYLSKTHLEQWTTRYPGLQQAPKAQTPRKVGVVMASDTPAERRVEWTYPLRQTSLARHGLDAGIDSSVARNCP